MNTLDQIGFLMERVFSRVIHESTRKTVAGGITIAQLKALRYLSSNKEASLRDLAQALRISDATASELVGKTVQAGYVRTRRLVSDRRMIQLAILSKGHGFWRRPCASVGRTSTKILRRVDPEALELALKALEIALAQGEAWERLRPKRGHSAHPPQRKRIQ